MFTTGIDSPERKTALVPLTEEPDPEMVPDWTGIGLFATGIALGTVLGATAALLVAPESGRELRHRVTRRFGRGASDDSVWEQLADELAAAEKELAARED
jgi:hypothetical protein